MNMIIEKIPYFGDKDGRYGSCHGPLCVMMAFRYFFPDQDMSFEDLFRELRYKPKTWFFETYIVRFFSEKNINAAYFSTESLAVIESDLIFKRITGMEFTDENKDLMNIEEYNNSARFVLSGGLFKIRDVDLDLIKEQLKKHKIVIATINHNKLCGKKGYKGSFVLIKGFDDTGFICNDGSLGENIKIVYSRFKDIFYTQLWDTERSKSRDIVVIG